MKTVLLEGVVNKHLVLSYESDLSRFLMDQPHRNSNAMRQRKFRQKKVLEDPDYKKKECERIKKIQEKKRGRLTSLQAEELRLRKRKQKRLERERKRLQNLASANSNESQASITSSFQANSHINPYKSVQNYTKAVLKCMQSLPACPMKQKIVAKGVCKRLGLKVTEETSLSDRNELKEDKTV